MDYVRRYMGEREVLFKGVREGDIEVFRP